MPVMKKSFLFIHRKMHPLISWVRSQPLIIKLLFSIKIHKGIVIHYDTTTILFRKALKKEVKNQDKVLEMGIGQAALLSLYLAKTKKIIPHGVDISTNRVKDSSSTAQLNSVEVDFRQSDLFSNVHNIYDVIFFNPPYVHTSAGLALNLTKRLELESDAPWNGGIDGTAVLKKFIECSNPHLAPTGKLMIGVQDFYVRDSVIKEMAGLSNYYIHNTVSSLLNPSKIYVLKKVSRS